MTPTFASLPGERLVIAMCTEDAREAKAVTNLRVANVRAATDRLFDANPMAVPAPRGVVIMRALATCRAPVWIPRQRAGRRRGESRFGPRTRFQAIDGLVTR